MAVTPERYREIAGSFPTGVAVVTVLDAGMPRGLTTQSFVGLSMDPPLVMVSMDKTSRTLSAVERARAFVVNVLAADAEDVSVRFASKADDKFADLPWRGSTLAGGAPILEASVVAYAECALVERVEAGDHWILIGRVEGGEVLGGSPLLYHRRAYFPTPGGPGSA